jgi:hypothetical protein
MTRGVGVARFFVHTVTVEPFTGVSGYGVDQFAAAQTISGFLEASRKLVRNQNGEEVVSEAQFYTDKANVSLFPANSRVTYPGVVTRVIRPNLNDAPGLGLPEHLAVTLE